MRRTEPQMCVQLLCQPVLPDHYFVPSCRMHLQISHLHRIRYQRNLVIVLKGKQNIKLPSKNDPLCNKVSNQEGAVALAKFISPRLLCTWLYNLTDKQVEQLYLGIPSYLAFIMQQDHGKFRKLEKNVLCYGS